MNLKAGDERPLYEQLCDILKQEIASGRFSATERFPTEAELSETYSVSRNTVRAALKKLTNENLLVRRQGRGTFLNQEKLTRSFTSPPVTRSFSDMCRELGVKPGAKLIKSVIEEATEEDVEWMGLAPGDNVLDIVRIRYTDSTPVSVEVSHFPERYDFLLTEDLDNCSMFQMLQEKYGIRFSTTYLSLELCYASYEMARYLNQETGYPLLLITSVQQDNNGVPHRSLQYVLGDKFKFVL